MSQTPDAFNKARSLVKSVKFWIFDFLNVIFLVLLLLGFFRGRIEAVVMIGIIAIFFDIMVCSGIYISKNK